MLFVGKWMGPEIMLSEVSQSQTSILPPPPLVWNLEKEKKKTSV